MVLAGGPFGLGPVELVVILLVLVMLFGATRLADLGGSLGKGIREFKKNVQDEEETEGGTVVSTPVMTTPSSAIPAATQSPMTSVPTGDTIQAIKCNNCETLNPLSAKHCSNCGSALVAPVS
ncbi:MAG TPA: twin-arginine translocase TatA/TatE family subunit [Dehalococcoidia bacterium]|nr:twin-arginine translocase TatA/TatE family subunit [Dehalococcoidia bacterium]